jgi:hypothetical protein
MLAGRFFVGMRNRQVLNVHEVVKKKSELWKQSPGFVLKSWGTERPVLHTF